MRNNYQIQRSQDSVSKISRSKSKNHVQITAKLKQKESKWNDRFHLQHIPQYNYLNQPHSQYLRNKFRIPNRKNDFSKPKRNIQPSLQKNKVSNKPNPRKNQQRLKQAINKAFSDLKTLWYQKQIPACHMEIMTKMFNRQNYPMKILQDIKQQFSQISKQTSMVQKVMASIVSRQGCIQKIDQLIKQYQTQQLSQNKVVKLFQQKISHLRILTIHCIECVYQWKQAIQLISQKKFKPTYSIQGKSYLAKIVEDFHKIANSKINKIYYFEQKKADPFFLNYTLQNKKISNISKNLLKRIRLCEIMLLQDDPKQQQTKRTPLVTKLRIPPSMKQKQKSMPPRENQANPFFKKISIEYSQFSDYFTKLLEKSSFTKSFLPQIQMTKYEQITVFQANQTGDQLAFASDRYSSQRKIVILGLKSTLENVEVFCRSFCQYLWEHDNCTEIRISLVHHQIGDNLTVDLQFQKRLKLVGFRWISVIHNDDIRMTVFAIKRPLDMVAHKTARRKQAYPVVIQHLTVFSLEDNNDKKVPNRSQMCILSILELLKEMKKEDYQQVCRRDQYFSYLQSIKKIGQYLQKQAIKQNVTQGYETSFTYPGLKAFQIQNSQKIDKIFKGVQIIPKHIGNIYPEYISLFNTSFKYGSTTISDGKYTKFFPNKQNQILICQSNYPIYILQSDEQIINFFIIEVQEGFSMQSIDTIFHAMGQQSSFIDQFWLPNFRKSQDYSDEVGLKNTQIISTDYWTCLGSLTRKSRVRTKVIKPPFVFGVIHKKLLQMLQIPLFCTLINKDNIL